MKKHIINIIWSLIFLLLSIDIISWSYILENWWEYVTLTIGILGVLVNMINIEDDIKSIKNIKRKQESVE